MSTARPPLERLPTSRREWSSLLASLGVRPSKSLGQNFLVEHGVVDRIVRASGIGPGDLVVEVGPGLGVLTGHLLQAGAQVVAIELDRDLVPHLRRTFEDLETLTVVEADALEVELSEILPPGVPYSVVANLPYSVASAVLMHFLEQPRPPERMTVMVQREVADRIVAQPPEMTVLSVAVQVLAKPERAFTVAPGSFLPPPKVESAVVNLRPLGESRLPRGRRPLFFQLVNAGFRHKRKQLLNSMAFELDLPKDVIAARLTSAGIDPMRRAQTLSVDEWLRVLDAWDASE